MRTEAEIRAMTDKAYDHDHDNKFFAMTYEQGVAAALAWVIGDEDEEPVEE